MPIQNNNTMINYAIHLIALVLATSFYVPKIEQVAAGQSNNRLQCTTTRRIKEKMMVKRTVSR